MPIMVTKKFFVCIECLFRYHAKVFTKTCAFSHAESRNIKYYVWNVTNLWDPKTHERVLSVLRKRAVKLGSECWPKMWSYIYIISTQAIKGTWRELRNVYFSKFNIETSELLCALCDNGIYMWDLANWIHTCQHCTLKIIVKNMALSILVRLCYSGETYLLGKHKTVPRHLSIFFL